MAATRGNAQVEAVKTLAQTLSNRDKADIISSLLGSILTETAAVQTAAPAAAAPRRGRRAAAPASAIAGVLGGLPVMGAIAPKRRGGRPAGSKNRPKAQPAPVAVEAAPAEAQDSGIGETPEATMTAGQ